MPLPERVDLPPLLGNAPAFLELLGLVSRLAPVNRPLMVIGERGSGKELIAARLHYLSQRWEGPFIKLNCAALSENLLESELFGHAAGAFTGAARARTGRFELADGGTLFLDEIANASTAVQEKTLRAIEYGTFERLGSSRTVHVDVRLIGATHADLPALAEAGRFRHDLLDRLSFDVIHIPPLRERQGDIPLLANHFARAMAAEMDRPAFPGFSARAMAQLEAYHWPGNVRELRNVVERAVARSTAVEEPVSRITINPFDRRPALTAPATGSGATAPAGPAADGTTGKTTGAAAEPPATHGFRRQVAAREKQLLTAALAAAGQDRRAAAHALDLTYDQLRGLLRKHGLGRQT